MIIMLDDDLKNFIAITASICTVLQFLTGIFVCLKFINNNGTGDTSPLPYITGCISTLLWLKYGLLIADTSIIVVNLIGVILFIGYTTVFYCYTIQKRFILKYVFLGIIFITITHYVVIKSSNLEDSQKLLGLIASSVTIIFFAAPLANLMEVLKTKSTDTLPFPIIFAGFIVSLQWLLYGFIISDIFVQISNLLGCLLSGFQLSLFCIFKKTSKIPSTPELL